MEGNSQIMESNKTKIESIKICDLYGTDGSIISAKGNFQSYPTLIKTANYVFDHFDYLSPFKKMEHHSVLGQKRLTQDLGITEGYFSYKRSQFFLIFPYPSISTAFFEDLYCLGQVFLGFRALASSFIEFSTHSKIRCQIEEKSILSIRL